MSSSLLWFSCHYLLIKVENNSPGPGHLCNGWLHSSVYLPAGSRFRYSGHHTSTHWTSSFHLTRRWSMWDQKASHFICCLSMHECIVRGFLLASPLACNWLCPEAKSLVFRSVWWRKRPATCFSGWNVNSHVSHKNGDICHPTNATC